MEGQKTKSDFIEWDKLQLLTQQLERDKDYKFCLLITTSMYLGTRIGDTLQLRWNDLMGREHLELKEKKTGKTRKILINHHLMETIIRIHKKMNPQNLDDFIFLNDMGTKPISQQFVNGKLKRLVVKYQTVKDPTKVKSHSIRKSFGRRVYGNRITGQSVDCCFSMRYSTTPVSRPPKSIWVSVKKSCHRCTKTCKQPIWIPREVPYITGIFKIFSFWDKKSGLLAKMELFIGITLKTIIMENLYNKLSSEEYRRRFYVLVVYRTTKTLLAKVIQFNDQISQWGTK